MTGCLVLRQRQKGDRICIDAAGHHKKLKDHLIDRKIPRHLRDELYLLAVGSDVVWILGDRISAACKVSEKTKRILKIEIIGE